jgi:DNA-binding MarR family transcriptional regulator
VAAAQADLQGLDPCEEAAEVRLSYVVGRLDRALRRDLEKGVRPFGLTALQYTLLSILAVRSGLSNAQLARRSLMSPQSMSEVLSGLERKGYIRRTAHPAHARILRVELTAAGKEAVTACSVVVDAIEERLLRGFSLARREALARDLRRCVQNLGAGLADGR